MLDLQPQGAYLVDAHGHGNPELDACLLTLLGTADANGRHLHGTATGHNMPKVTVLASLLAALPCFP